MERAKRTILIIVHDKNTASFLLHQLADIYDLIISFCDNIGLRRLIQEKHVDFVFLEKVVSDADGLPIFHSLRSIRPNIPIVFLEDGQGQIPESAIVETRINLYLRKPFGEKELMDTLRRLDASRYPRKSDVEKAVNFISEHLKERITAQDIAAACCLSYRQIERKFKDTFGLSIMQYVRQQRVEVAKGLLRGRAMWIDDIATILGFADARAFRSAFRSLTGMTPKQYQLYHNNAKTANISSQRQLPVQI